MEIMKETQWSRIQGQISVCKEFLEIVGNGSPTDSILKETIALSATISISVEKWHSRIRLRSLACSRMREKHREPEVAEEEVPEEGISMALQRLPQKNLHLHSVKSGTLQNTCSTRPRVVAGLGKSALMHIVKLMNNLVKGLQRKMTKAQ